MIRINLLPTKKKSAKAKAVAADPGQNRAAAVFFFWVILGGASAFGLKVMLDDVEAETKKIQDETAQVKKRTEEIRSAIDEDQLNARKAEAEAIASAVEHVEAQKRTPTFVMNELGNVLTTGKLPDIDQEEQRQCEARDPNCKLNLSWDAKSVWIDSLNEGGGDVIEIKGFARDAADLSEFTKRLRSSARFTDVTHPRYQDSNDGTFIQFELTFRVVYWD